MVRGSKKFGAPAWVREPRKARFVPGVVFTPERGVIHPSFPLRGRWERPAKIGEKAPSASLAFPGKSSNETHPHVSTFARTRPSPCQTSFPQIFPFLLLKSYILSRLSPCHTQIGIGSSKTKLDARHSTGPMPTDGARGLHGALSSRISNPAENLAGFEAEVRKLSDFLLRAS